MTENNNKLTQKQLDTERTNADMMSMENEDIIPLKTRIADLEAEIKELEEGD